jgi:hypothetical protein
VLTALHFFSAYENKPSMTMREITDAIIKARVPTARTMNVSAVLIGLVPRVERRLVSGLISSSRAAPSAPHRSAPLSSPKLATPTTSP